ncbi:quinoprotein relay system zinc metallohydrolase 2 [Candidimonas sp. SYP-B2681]|uniref:quinoprotein relay system zinc metallohydrolase 2 n=1 Tax=Candidimonas sp. SYP-B2681 TaxID=2497686 RepID=UPI000F85D09A|nr:quinoprotein relay system zinc metallohydrolase 2 [Candidimonas sp. SYP-B2681]RTZ42420.1 quinoprotein relay system zinc metallohydrolase 2 [Candidimonas sp. SYP-B2681]
MKHKGAINVLIGFLVSGSLVLAAQAQEPLSVQPVSSGVFVHIAVHEDATADNRGMIANVGFIIGQRCVAVIDSGGSLAGGRALRAAIRLQTDKPVCYVINTHVHPDHIYGNSAFIEDRPRYIGHRNLAAAMRARQVYYAAYLDRTIGTELARPSALVFPDQFVDSVQEIDLGDRKLILQAWPTSHTDNDLTVFDVQTATLWLGDLLFRERIPTLDGRLAGWLSTMTQLESIPARQVVPGHGQFSSDWPAVLIPQREYLQRLQKDVRSALKANRSLQQATDEIGASNRAQWKLFEESHRHNVTAAFTELEWED